MQWRPGKTATRCTAAVGSDRTACDSQLVEYQRGVTKEKNEQIGDLQSTLKQMQKLTLFQCVEAERQKWEARETITVR